MKVQSGSSAAPLSAESITEISPAEINEAPELFLGTLKEIRKQIDVMLADMAYGADVSELPGMLGVSAKEVKDLVSREASESPRPLGATPDTASVSGNVYPQEEAIYALLNRLWCSSPEDIIANLGRVEEEMKKLSPRFRDKYAHQISQLIHSAISTLDDRIREAGDDLSRLKPLIELLKKMSGWLETAGREKYCTQSKYLKELVAEQILCIQDRIEEKALVELLRRLESAALEDIIAHLGKVEEEMKRLSPRLRDKNAFRVHALVDKAIGMIDAQRSQAGSDFSRLLPVIDQLKIISGWMQAAGMEDVFKHSQSLKNRIAEQMAFIEGKAATAAATIETEFHRVKNSAGWGVADGSEDILRQLQDMYNALRERMPELARSLKEKIDTILYRIEAMKNYGLHEICNRDLEMMLLMTQLGRARICEAVVKDQISRLKERNEIIRKLNQAMGVIRQAHADGHYQDKDNKNKVELRWLCTDGRHVNRYAPQHPPGEEALSTLLIRLGVISESETFAWFDVNALCSNRIQGKIDNLNQDQQMDMNRMQTLSSKRNEAYDVLTTTMKKFHELMSELVRRMG